MDGVIIVAQVKNKLLNAFIPGWRTLEKWWRMEACLPGAIILLPASGRFFIRPRSGRRGRVELSLQVLMGWGTSRRSQSSERKSWLLARSEGLAADQRAMNAAAESVDMARGSVGDLMEEMKEKQICSRAAPAKSGKLAKFPCV